MISLIGDKKKYKVDKFILSNVDLVSKEAEISLLLSKSDVIIFDTLEIENIPQDIMRSLIESNVVYFTSNSITNLFEYLKTTYHTNYTFKVIGDYTSLDFNIECYSIEEVLKKKREKVSLHDEIKYGITEILQNKMMILKLSYSNFQLETKNTTLGSYWHIVRDIIFFVTYISFMIFMRGNSDIEQIPAILYLVVGLVPWYYMSDILNGGVNCIRNNRHIISKVKFPITIIPFYYTIGAFYKRALTYLILFIVMFYYFMTGEMTVFKPILFIYINVSMIIFMTAFNLVISSLISVSRDFTELYKSIVRVQFYFLPIFWDFTMIQDKLYSSNQLNNTIGEIIGIALKLNPIAYILNVFRVSVGATSHISPFYTSMFWLTTLILFIVGFSLQYRLRKIYADVL